MLLPPCIYLIHPRVNSQHSLNSVNLHKMSDYFEAEKCLQEAILYKQAHSHTFLQFLSHQFHVNKNHIYCQLKDQNSHSIHSSINLKLDSDQNLALCQYIEHLYHIGVSFYYKAIGQAVNQ